jgi:uncharacterized protein YbcI
METDLRTATEAAINGSKPADSVLATISREMVRIYKEDFGRGPTKASTRFAGHDILVATLEDSLTPAEKRLRELGKGQRLRDTRTLFQHASEGRFVGAVESALNREVRAFVSGIDVENDVATEVFYLKQVDEPGEEVP